MDIITKLDKKYEKAGINHFTCPCGKYIEGIDNDNTVANVYVKSDTGFVTYWDLEIPNHHSYGTCAED